MPQRYKVYFSNRPVVFVGKAADPESSVRNSTVLESRGKMDTMYIEQAISRGAKSITLVCKNPGQSWNDFREQFEFVQAAGGIVRNAQGKILFIFRNDKWDLPKGKVEEGESNEVAALREVAEECSLHSTQLLGPVCETWHTYIQDGIPVLKSTAWFAMALVKDENAEPQLAEGITETRWLDLEESKIVRANTYPSILDVLNAFESFRTSTRPEGQATT